MVHASPSNHKTVRVLISCFPKQMILWDSNSIGYYQLTCLFFSMFWIRGSIFHTLLALRNKFRYVRSINSMLYCYCSACAYNNYIIHSCARYLCSLFLPTCCSGRAMSVGRGPKLSVLCDVCHQPIVYRGAQRWKVVCGLCNQGTVSHYVIPDTSPTLQVEPLTSKDI